MVRTGELLRRIGVRSRGTATSQPWPSIALAVAAGATLVLLVHQRWGSDFQLFDLQIYRSSLLFWLDGRGNLYDYTQTVPINGDVGFTYPPFAAVVLTPIAWLSVDGMADVVRILTAVATAAMVFLMLRVRVKSGSWALLVGTVVGSGVAAFLSPIDESLGFGQINVILALLVALDVLYLGPKRSKWAGVGIGLAMAIKLTPGIFLLALLLTRQWSVALRALAAAAAATALAVVIAPHDSWEFFSSVLWQTDRVGFQENVSNQALSGMFARLASPGSLPTLWWLPAVAVVLVIGAVRVRKAAAAEDPLAVLALTGLVGLLVSPVSWIHHCVWIAPALLIIGWDVSSSRPRSAQWWWSVLMLLSGWFVWFQSIRRHFQLPDLGYQHAGFLLQLEASLPLWWMVLAVLTLPILQGRAVAAQSRPRTGGARA